MKKEKKKDSADKEKKRTETTLPDRALSKHTVSTVVF